MNPEDIELKNLNKGFEYIKIAREIDEVTSIEILKDVAKCYAKLYLKTQESVVEFRKFMICLIMFIWKSESKESKYSN